MSYNVAICTPPVPAEDDTAWDGLDSLINEQGAPPPVFRELHDALTARYPCIRTLPDDKVDEEGVWSDGPLWNDFGHRAAGLGMIWSRVEEVLPFPCANSEFSWPNRFRLGRPHNLSAGKRATPFLT
jgi:hypothetical protein